MSFTVKLEQFEGPLDLLLELIQKEKLEITRISLAKVTDSYLGHLRENLDISSDNLADFLVVAARLILIKSKALLPILELTPDEEESIQDLEARLAMYKKFKEVSQLLGARFDKRQFSFSRKGFEGVKQGFFPPPDIDAGILEKTMSRILAEMPKAEKLAEESIKEVMTLEQKIIELKSSLRHRIETSFKILTARAKDKTEIIVTFLAILELFKAKIITVEQKEIFGEIMISKKEAIQ
ncbi:segregation/condensation protein A [Patescibacteria group bacterium]|nr:segregation/condensation protein A [Patescibacteria group bacterium]MBU4579554.1 segregation/condensation protein A [Patescibacteria group bacterium]